MREHFMILGSCGAAGIAFGTGHWIIGIPLFVLAVVCLINADRLREVER